MHFRALGKTGFCGNVKIFASFPVVLLADHPSSMIGRLWNTNLHACIGSPRVRAHV